MKIQTLASYCFILLLASCSSRQFAFRKTVDAETLQTHIIPKQAIVINNTACDECAPAITGYNSSSIKIQEASKLPVKKSFLQKENTPAFHHDIITVASDPIPPIPVNPDNERPDGNAGLIALCLFTIASLTVVLYYTASFNAAIAIAPFLFIAAFILSIIGLKRKRFRGAAIAVLVLSILSLFALFAIEYARGQSAH